MRRLRVATLCCVVSINRDTRSVSKDVVAGQEAWEEEGSSVHVEGYKWFGKPHTSQNTQYSERERSVGFLVHDCL